MPAIPAPITTKRNGFVCVPALALSVFFDIFPPGSRTSLPTPWSHIQKPGGPSQSAAISEKEQKSTLQTCTIRTYRLHNQKNPKEPDIQCDQLEKGLKPREKIPLSKQPHALC